LPIGYERRLKCWDSFIGSYGRSKNVALFYCFVLWEDVTVIYSSRRLPINACVVGGGDEGNGGGSTPLQRDAVHFSRKEMKQLALLQSIVSPPSTSSSDTRNSDYNRKRERVLDERASSIAATRLGDSMDHAHFQQLDPDKQKQIEDKWFESVMK
jgi:hypothetical protein